MKNGKDVSKFLNSFKGFTGKKIIDILKLSEKHFWQESSFDHVIRNEEDFKNHYDYIHYNPVKHGIAIRPEDYKFSSFKQAVKKGYYDVGWGYKEPLNVKELDSNLFGE